MKACKFLAAACLVLPFAAHAQPVKGPYVSLGAGTSFLNSVAVNYPLAFEQQTGRIIFRPSYAGDVSLGYGLGNGFRFEIEANYYRNTAAKFDADPSFFGSPLQGKQTGNQSTYGGMANALYDIPVGWPVFPYVGVGVGYQMASIRKMYNNLDAGEGYINGTKGSFAYQIIGGLAYPLPMVPGLSVTADYRFMQLTASRNYSVSGDDEAAHVEFGQQSSHTFLIGLRYQICNPPPAAPATAAAAAPVAAAPAPAPARTYLVFFDWDKADLTPRATQIIAQAASDSKTQSTTSLDVSGYTDTSGTADYNQGLSLRRAKAVAGQLVTDGVPASEIEIQAFGETHLLVPTGPGVREPQNRRVEIVLN